MGIIEIVRLKKVKVLMVNCDYRVMINIVLIIIIIIKKVHDYMNLKIKDSKSIYGGFLSHYHWF